MRTPLLDEPVTVAPKLLDQTFRVFLSRKLVRRLHGPGISHVATPLWAAACLGALGVALWAGRQDWRPYGQRLHAGPAEALLGSLFCAITLAAISHARITVRWCTYWAYLASLALIVTRDATSTLPSEAASARFTASELRWRGAAVLFGLELATPIACTVLIRALPAGILRLVHSVRLSWFWELRRVEASSLPPPAAADRLAPIGGAPRDGAPTRRRAHIAYSCRPCVLGCPLPTSRAHVVSYDGEIDDLGGMPDGHGEWVDDSFHGERLRGHWEAGVPTAPFLSREHDSGHAFACVRIAFCATHGYPHDATRFRTISARLPAGELRFGVCAVECATSGVYFGHLPATRSLWESSEHETGHEAGHESGAHTNDANATASQVGHCLQMLAPRVRDRDEQPGQSARPAAEAPVAVIYIPGFNTPLAYALDRFGQFLAIANLPDHMHPLVFSWPGGRALSYLAAARTAAEPCMAEDLLRLMHGLHAHGVRTIHLLAHSMGARLVMHALPALQASPLFAQAGGLVLGSTVLLSPDYPLASFVESGVASLAALGTATTIYGDRHDQPLHYSEMVTRLLAPCAWRSLGRLHGAPWAHATRSAHACDVDVIDTTWMHAGLPAGDPDLVTNTRMRHSQFTINRIIVDDLVDHLTTGRRAAQRNTRLHLRATGVFHFFPSGE